MIGPLALCPRADPEALRLLTPPFNGEMVWREDNTCSYCGSLNPDVFMEHLAAGHVVLGPTEKNYKVYVANADDAQVLVRPGKFYFQHLSPNQRTRFIELYNANRVHLSFPGHFPVPPFFCARAGPPPMPDDGA